MEQFNSEKVKKTLKMVVKKLEDFNIEYRLLGSVVAASLLGHQHRKLGDLDFIITKKIHDHYSVTYKKSALKRKRVCSVSQENIWHWKN